MSERLPVTARGTEPARATVVGSVFDLHGLRCRSDPATAAADETEMQAAVARAPAAPADVAQYLTRGGGPRARPHQPVLEQPAVDSAFAQALELVQAQLPITPDDLSFAKTPSGEQVVDLSALIRRRS